VLKAALLLAFAAVPAALASAPLRVVTFHPVLTEIAREVGGNDVSVFGLVRPGIDPHDFEPAPGDVATLVDAELILATGFGLDDALARLAAGSGARASIVRASDVLTGGPRSDPHWWNSPKATERVTALVAAQLVLRRPEKTAEIQRRAADTIGRLQELADWGKRELSAVPGPHRRLVTTHDAFGWFAREYGFEVRSVTGPNPEAEPNARDFARLIDYLRREKVPAIFVEDSSSPGLAAALAGETGARIGGVLYADGPAATGDDATYAGMFRHNVLTIVAALK